VTSAAADEDDNERNNEGGVEEASEAATEAAALANPRKAAATATTPASRARAVAARRSPRSSSSTAAATVTTKAKGSSSSSSSSSPPSARGARRARRTPRGGARKVSSSSSKASFPASSSLLAAAAAVAAGDMTSSSSSASSVSSSSAPSALLEALAATSSSSASASALASLLSGGGGVPASAAFGGAAAAASSSPSSAAVDFLAPFSSRAAHLAAPCPAGLDDTEEAADLLLLRQLDKKLRAGRDAVHSMRAAASATATVARRAAAAASAGVSAAELLGAEEAVAASNAAAGAKDDGDDDDSAVPVEAGGGEAGDVAASASEEEGLSSSSSSSEAAASSSSESPASSSPAAPAPSPSPTTAGSALGVADPSKTSASSSADAVSSFLKSLGHTGVLSREAELRLAQVVGKGVRAAATAEAEAVRLGRAPGIPEVISALDLRSAAHLELLLANRQAATDLMVQFNLRLVFHCAKRYTGLGLEMGDLIAEGVAGLTRAIDKFDTTRGNRFSTYAMWWIRQAVTRSISEQSRIVRLPVHIYEAVARIRRAAREVGGGCDSPEQLHAAVAAETGLPVEKVERYLAAAKGASSIDVVAPTNSSKASSDSSSDPLSELLPCAASFAAADRRDAAERDTVLAAALDAVLASLPQRERNVLRMRYGLGGRRGRTMTLSDISAAYGVTTERIRQIEDSGLRRLREPGRAEGVATAAAMIGEVESREF
jgi:RNA polymerase primary sigma factor